MLDDPLAYSETMYRTAKNKALFTKFDKEVELFLPFFLMFTLSLFVRVCEADGRESS